MTLTYANNTYAQIDYVFIDKKWKNSAVNCEAYSSFEGVSSDHRNVTAKIILNLRKTATRITTTIHYDWALINIKDIKNKYVVALKNKFDALQEMTETHTPNDNYENFVNAHFEKKRSNLESHEKHLRLEKKRADMKNCHQMQ